MNDLQDFFENKARSGDAGFAIAYALMDLAAAQETHRHVDKEPRQR